MFAGPVFQRQYKSAVSPVLIIALYINIRKPSTLNTLIHDSLLGETLLLQKVGFQELDKKSEAASFLRQLLNGFHTS